MLNANSFFICPECEEELEQIDSYGYFAAHQSGRKIGEIFKCLNEDCAEEFFYTDNNDNLHVGYPC